MKYVNVSKETLDTLGAVSEQTAKEMAEGVAKANQANVGVGITGIAGPTGGTVEKPVGTVCFGYTINGETKRRQYTLAISEETWSGRKAWSMF